MFFIYQSEECLELKVRCSKLDIWIIEWEEIDRKLQNIITKYSVLFSL